MIARISGLLIEKQAPNLLVDVSGVGYEILVPMTTFYALPEMDKRVVLHIHHAISENAQQLFGFYHKDDRAFFRLLIKVNGVGPKMAMGIMSIEISELIRYIRDNNIAALTKVPGVGKKTAERLVIDMRDKIKSWGADAEREVSGHTLLDGTQSNIVAEAESALVALGYKPVDAAKSIARVNSGDIVRSEELIRLALKSMMPA